MKVLCNGDANRVTQLMFSNGWTVSMSAEPRSIADGPGVSGSDVMIWNGKGVSVPFPRPGSVYTDSELYGLSDDQLGRIITYVQDLGVDSPVHVVGHHLSIV